MIYKPDQSTFNDKTDNTTGPLCVVGETLQVSFEICNPLQGPLELSQLRLRCVRSQTEGDAGGEEVGE